MPGTTCKVKSHLSNLAHGTLDYVMGPQAMWLNIQCQWQSNIKLSNTNVQYENILFYFNLRWVYVKWKGDIGLSPG